MFQCYSSLNPFPPPTPPTPRMASSDLISVALLHILMKGADGNGKNYRAKGRRWGGGEGVVRVYQHELLFLRSIRWELLAGCGNSRSER